MGALGRRFDLSIVKRITQKHVAEEPDGLEGD